MENGPLLMEKKQCSQAGAKSSEDGIQKRADGSAENCDLGKLFWE